MLEHDRLDLSTEWDNPDLHFLADDCHSACWLTGELITNAEGQGLHAIQVGV
jgi:hypothetical protein